MIQPLKISLIVLAVLVACLGALALEAQTKIVHRLYDNYILDNKNHYLPCEQLHIEAEVSRIVQEHQDIIQAIERVNPGLVGVELDTGSCPGMADLIIWYATHQDRVIIERIIGGNSFFGVPYRLQNR